MARRAAGGTRARHWAPLLAGLCIALAGCGRGEERAVVVNIIGQSAEMTDPLRHERSAPAKAVLAATAQGLVAFDAQGGVVPGLAESWIVGDGGQSYIFRLRRARWANGEPVKADAVALILQQRMRASPDVLAGLRPDVRAMTDRVIEIRLDTALPPFIQLLAQPRLAIIGQQGGTGPYAGEARLQRLYLRPVASEADEEDGIPPPGDVRDRRTLEAARAALAVARFQNGRTDLVLGGRFQHLLLLPHARLGSTDVRADPAPGLFGLAIADQRGFLADRAVRAALAQAVDRAQLARDLNLQNWTTSIAPLPAQLDMAQAPTLPDWSALATEERIRTARQTVAAWRAAHGEPPLLRIALPEGAGATLLFHRLAADYGRLGLRVARVDADDTAELRLLDAVAGFDSALWYLALLDCGTGISCDPGASAQLDIARSAQDAAQQAAALSAAERLIVAHGGFIPLGLPIRWSLVSNRLTAFAPSPRAVHPLNSLRRTTN